MPKTMIITAAARRPLTQADLSALQAIANDHHAQAGLTGLTLCNDRRVIHVLQGEDAPLEAFCRAVNEQTAYGTVEVLFTAADAPMDFAGWTVDYRPDEMTAMPALEGLHPFGAAG